MTALRLRAVAALALFTVLPIRGVSAQSADPAGLGDRGIVAHRQALLDLTNPFTVMCVACHPDDEDGPTLTVERRKYGARTVTLFATSGEGGQNAVGPELYDELGRIREHETLAAAEIQGSTPYFLRLRDFGFSKSGDEAMRVWEAQEGGHDKLLERWVRALRELRPNVVITNHDTKTGHGQHQATGRLIVEAVAACADGSRFPDAGSPWKVQSLLVRVPEKADGGVVVNAGEYDPVRGMTYREIAFRALLQHATQGPWSFDFVPGSARYEQVVRSSETGAGIGSPLTQPLAVPPGSFSVERAAIDGDTSTLKARLVDVAARGGLSVPDRRRLDAALAALCGVDVSLEIATPSAPIGDQIEATLTIANTSNAPVTISKLQFPRYLVRREMEEPAEAWEDSPVPANSVRTFVMLLNIVGTVSNGAAMFPPVESPPPTAARPAPNSAVGFFGIGLDLVSNGVTFSVNRLEYLDVASPVSLSFTTHGAATLLRALNTSARPVTLCGLESGGKRVVVSDKLAPGAESTYELAPNAHGPVSVDACLDPDVHGDNARTTIEIQRLNSTVIVAPGIRVGYVRSYEYTIPESLERLGVAHRELSVADVRDGDLSRFSTIIIDNRAYLKYPDLKRYNARLLDYARNGGNLIVFYHKRGEYSADLAPYPITIGPDRITDENAPVEMLLPQHRIFRYPNLISAGDFEHWTQERGLYFPSEWDQHYQALLSSHDPGEKPLTGGLLVARYGTGSFIYTSYVWYRQLRALVPGGFRIFANMISYKPVEKRR